MIDKIEFGKNFFYAVSKGHGSARVHAEGRIYDLLFCELSDIVFTLKTYGGTCIAERNMVIVTCMEEDFIRETCEGLDKRGAFQVGTEMYLRSSPDTPHPGSPAKFGNDPQ